MITGCDTGIGHELAKYLDSIGFQVTVSVTSNTIGLCFSGLLYCKISKILTKTVGQINQEFFKTEKFASLDRDMVIRAFRSFRGREEVVVFS